MQVKQWSRTDAKKAKNRHSFHKLCRWVWGLPRHSNVVPFLVILIRVLTKKPYQIQKGTTLEGPGRV